MFTTVPVLMCLALAAGPSAQTSAPTIDDLLNLKRVGSPAISPDGRSVAYTVRETNWEENDYETEIWVGTAAETRQLTSGRKSSLQPAWSPDGRWLAFISDRDGKRQLYRIALSGGEAEKLTKGDEGVNAFAWAPDGQRIALTMTDPVSDSVKEREKTFGEFRIEDQDRRMAHLYLLTLPASGVSIEPPRQLTRGEFVVGSFDWSPDGQKIAFDHRVSSDPADGSSSDISVVTVASGERKAVVAQNGPDSNPRWSPDGAQIAFVTAMSKPFDFYQNDVVAVVAATGGAATSLTDAFDENPSLTAWTPRGIFFSASQRTWSYLFQLDPQSKQITRHAVKDAWIGSGYSVTRDGRSAAFVGAGPTDFADVSWGRWGSGAGGAGKCGEACQHQPHQPHQPSHRDAHQQDRRSGGFVAEAHP